ncbi:MAG: Hsp20/alpha crystallin family protein [Desulfobacteraceae bacterium]|nr:Hsp20/alpha crystallin family protein [Desulfobacteraceae bacterium]
MELMRWNPAKSLFGLPSRFDTLFDSFFFPTRTDGGQDGLWSWNPAVDVYENDDAIVLKAELPGVDKDQITVDVEGRILTLKGERKSENEVKEDNYYRRERTYGRFERSFTLPEEVNADAIKAEYKDGVLKVEVPKPEVKKPKQITVH